MIIIRPSPMPLFSSQDKLFMRRALTLARRGRGKTWPNPAVGCVIVKNGKIVGEGWHKRSGGPHAEAEALSRAGTSAKGAVAYATLEPCVKFPGKKTPSCAEALVKAGISRVVIANFDPHGNVTGQGLRLLKHSGVETLSGLLSDQAQALNEDYSERFKGISRPYVILKLALSLDGRPFAEGGLSRWITGPKSRDAVHRLRASCDAVLVGVGTVLADDPALTSHGAGRNPIRVVLDSWLRVPKRAKIFDGKAPTWILTGAKKLPPHPSPLPQRGEGRTRRISAELIQVPLSGGKIDLKRALNVLARRGIRKILVEGGPAVWASFLRQNLVDEIRTFIAPKLLSGTRDPNKSPVLKDARLKRLGSDFLFYGKVK
jgi:diaminohydroxyphosphoribosylaminopyrimidine deaminase/5-amino-6-(5-phosphoribosylamino)uracil reductase